MSEGTNEASISHVVDTLLARNEAFARERFSREPKMMPSMRTIVLGCVDPRVDPADVLGLALGEVAVIRNVGGRVTPSLIETLTMLRVVVQVGSGGRLDMGAGFHLIVLHHTDCGIQHVTKAPELLATFFGEPAASFDPHAHAVSDPHASVKLDVAALQANPLLPAAITVSGLVYDVATGRIETVVTPTRLRG